jgi:uncharacterized RDD family membrane protein YckC
MSEGEGSTPGSWQPGDGNWSQPAPWTSADDAYLGAADLSARLRNGQRLPPLDSAIVLRPEEQVLHWENFTAHTYSRTAVSYNSGFVAAFGSPTWLAASLGGSALYNNYQRGKAEAQAAAQWRPVDQGIIHVTSQRLCLQGRLNWVDIGFGDIRAFDALPDGVVVHRQGQSPVKIATPAVAYLYVLLSFLASGQVISVPLPADFADRARRAGRDVPFQDPGTSSGFAAGPWHAAGPMPSAPWPAAQALSSVYAPGAWTPPSRPGPRADVLGRPYADWGTRAVAYVIDSVVVICGWALLLGAVVAGTKLRTAPTQYGSTGTSGAGVAIIVVSLLGLVGFTFGYYLLHGGESGQTPGKRAVGIQVRDAQTGGPISYARAFGRFLAELLAGLILPILVFVDLLWPLWDDRQQALHDKAVNTVVIMKVRAVVNHQSDMYKKPAA